MANDLRNFKKISRQTWKSLGHHDQAPLTEGELDSIKSLNDQISIQDVTDIYLPLIHFIGIYKQALEHLKFSKSLFLQQKTEKSPFIIGISGSVAVGKSTTSRLLQLLLARTFKSSKVELITTDGFLYPNKILKEEQLLDRKGFPESYNMPLLIQCLEAIRNGEDCHIPIYSHDIYDIVPNKYHHLKAPDILIIEGINVFQHLQNDQLYMTSYFDFSIYIDADEKHIQKWYLERFDKLLDLAKDKPTNYYYRFHHMAKEEVTTIAQNTWQNINHVNLKHYIEPTKTRAEVILHKASNHKIDEIYVKK